MLSCIGNVNINIGLKCNENFKYLLLIVFELKQNKKIVLWKLFM